MFTNVCSYLPSDPRLFSKPYTPYTPYKPYKPSKPSKPYKPYKPYIQSKLSQAAATERNHDMATCKGGEEMKHNSGQN